MRYTFCHMRFRVLGYLMAWGSLNLFSLSAEAFNDHSDPIVCGESLVSTDAVLKMPVVVRARLLEEFGRIRDYRETAEPFSHFMALSEIAEQDTARAESDWKFSTLESGPYELDTHASVTSIRSLSMGGEVLGHLVLIEARAHHRLADRSVPGRLISRFFIDQQLISHRLPAYGPEFVPSSAK
jgi:hypothetical protein